MSMRSRRHLRAAGVVVRQAVLTAYDLLVLADGPRLYHTLGPDGGVADASGHGHSAAVYNSPTFTALPSGDGAMVFDGTTQYVETTDADDLSVPTTGIVTIEAWLRPDVLEFPASESTGYVHWLGKGVAGQHEYTARMYSYTNSEVPTRPNRISGYAFNAAGGLGAGSYFQDVVTPGEWIHYVLVINTVAVDATYTTGYTKIYKNATWRDQDALSDYSIIPSNGSAPFRIGTRDFGSFFKGALSKVAVYDYELTPQQIHAHYRQIVPVTTGTAQFVRSVGSGTAAATGTTMTITVANIVPAGHTLLARAMHSYTASAPTISDSRGNVYTRDRSAANGATIRASVFSAPITTTLQVGDTITVVFPSSADRVAAIDEFSGVLTASALDQQNGKTGISTSPNVSPGVTPVQADELIYAMTAVNGPTSDTYTEDSLAEWQTLSRVGVGSNTLNAAYKSVSSSAAYDYAPTLGASRPWIEFALSYKAAGQTIVNVSNAGQLTTALANAVPGQTIQLADGTYSGQFTIINKTATASQPIIIQGSSNAIISGGSMSGGYAFHVDNCQYVTLKGFQVTGAQKSVVLDQTTFSTLDGLTTHDCGCESILLRNLSCDNVVKNCEIYNTGLVTPDYGEGIYIGLYYGDWSGGSSRTGGAPDASDRNQLLTNTIHNTAAECIDIKEGTNDGIIRGNILEGASMSGANYADSWIDIAGCGYLVENNTGTNALLDGIQTHTQPQPAVTASNNIFRSNTMAVNASGYGINIDTSGTGNIVYATNSETGAASGLTNISVTP